MVANIFSRLVGASLLATGGWWLGEFISYTWWPESYVLCVFGLTGAGAIIGLLATPYVTAWMVYRLVAQVEGVPTSRLLSGIIGTIVGLLLAILVSIPVSRIPGWAGIGLPIAISIFLAYLGAMLLSSPKRDVFQELVSSGRISLSRNGRSAPDSKLLVDTSAIIDGRIADITHTGFLHGTLVIPSFVLDELRHIADSSDSLRRTRGRRGLEMLNKLRKDPQISSQIIDFDRRNGREVDATLVELAKELNAAIITTDYNLNRVAQIQGVSVLNINELANSLKPVVLPGEAMNIRVVQEGKEPGQGVGFLDDGTMVVVEYGNRYLNQNVDVQVTRVLQTAAGCIIFAQPKRG